VRPAVTGSGNVLVVSVSSTICEYTPSGSLVRQITDSNNIWHAVEVTSGVWAYSRNGPVHGIAVVSANGTMLRSFDGSETGSGTTPMNDPRGLAIDSKVYVYVTDHGNDRILLVDQDGR